MEPNLVQQLQDEAARFDEELPPDWALIWDPKTGVFSYYIMTTNEIRAERPAEMKEWKR